MSAITMDMLAAIEAVNNAKNALVRISTPILLVLGNLSEIVSIIILVQPIFRRNPCAIYFLAASFIRLIYINYMILINGLSLGYRMDPSDKSLILCKIKTYVYFVTTILPPSFVVLACIDRLMLTSINANFRSWSRPSFAYRALGGVSIFWLLFSIHCFFGSVIYFEPNGSYCYIQEGLYMMFVTFYAIISNYLLPPTLMVIFGSMAIMNVRQAQRRIRTRIDPGFMQRKDRYLLRMLLFQVLVNVIFTIPIAIYQIFQVVSANWSKDLLWQTWNVFFLALCLMIFYIPYCTSLYVYTLTASIFREELKKIIIRCFRSFIRQREVRITTTPNTAT